MNIYTITVHAVGYTTVQFDVTARSLAEARKQEYNAVSMWLKENDVDEDTRGLAFVKTTRWKGPIAGAIRSGHITR